MGGGELLNERPHLRLGVPQVWKGPRPTTHEEIWGGGGGTGLSDDTQFYNFSMRGTSHQKN